NVLSSFSIAQADKSRMTSSRSTNTTHSRRQFFVMPITAWRGSPSTVPASTTRRNGSKKTSQTVSNEILCLRRFVLDFRSSHSNSISCNVQVTSARKDNTKRIYDVN